MEQSMSNEVEKKPLSELFDGVAHVEREARDLDRKAAEGKREGVYKRLAHSYGVACEAMSEERLDELVREMLRKQVPMPKEGANKWLAPTRCMYGAFNVKAPKVQYMGTANLTPWKWDRSFEKYASVFAWAEFMGFTAENLAEKVKNFSHDTYGKGITGIVNYWAARNGEKRAVAEKPRVFKAPKELEANGTYVVIVDVKDGTAIYRCPAPMDASEKQRIIGLAPKAGVEPNAEEVSKAVDATRMVWMKMPEKQLASRAVTQPA
ncbi:hypothetical protein J2847_005064 [Azospirillum agricola]|uniref:hypothetical protein n=1 Tax=Azospirillum agricola TaxID=1720247 RepID=UPI001AE57FA5|nr:hypothetical protein [Azospirillum agricola]MBP2231745.1 hypothetical protein [Azospirillum agricola]